MSFENVNIQAHGNFQLFRLYAYPSPGGIRRGGRLVIYWPHAIGKFYDSTTVDCKAYDLEQQELHHLENGSFTGHVDVRNRQAEIGSYGA